MWLKCLKNIEDSIIREISDRKYSRYYFAVLYKLYRFPVTNFLRLRSFCKPNIISKGKIQNIYHATVQKTGSQWIKAIFSDKRIMKQTGLRVYPQHGYDTGEFHKKFPQYTFVPGLYLPYELYREIKKPRRYKTFYVIRDPQNVVVSWYRSMKYSHRPNKKVLEYREQLKGLSTEEGINFCIRVFLVNLMYMKSWAYLCDDSNVLFVRFEDLTSSPFDGFKRIFEHCEIDISDWLLRRILDDYSKDKMRERDLARRRVQESNYSMKKSDWRKVFSKRNEEFFYQATGDLVKILGYEK